MTIWSLNSRKCSAIEAALLLSLALLSPSVEASKRKPSTPLEDPVLLSQLQGDLKKAQGANFEPLLQKWEKTHGTKGFGPLLTLARNRSESDAHRYIALMGAAKLGGSATAPEFVSLLTDRSWMIRCGALRALSALQNPLTAPAVLGMLKDKALVVRLEAVEAVERLNPEGAIDALVGTLGLSANYHHGKAQWVPQRALDALISLKARIAAPKLGPLLDRHEDPELQKLTVRALESLTGKVLRPNRPVVEQVRAWKEVLRETS